MQSHLEEIRALGGEVVAISTDSIQDAERMVGRRGFEFSVLADPELRVIDAYGLRHTNGGIEGDVARPAVFVLDREGRIVWRDFTENWRVRVRPEAVLEPVAGIP